MKYFIALIVVLMFVGCGDEITNVYTTECTVPNDECTVPNDGSTRVKISIYNMAQRPSTISFFAWPPTVTNGEVYCKWGQNISGSNFINESGVWTYRLTVPAEYANELFLTRITDDIQNKTMKLNGVVITKQYWTGVTGPWYYFSFKLSSGIQNTVAYNK